MYENQKSNRRIFYYHINIKTDRITEWVMLISSNNNDIVYNSYLDYSDYKYRIADYKMSEAEPNAKLKDMDGNSSSIEEGLNVDDQLRAFVT